MDSLLEIFQNSTGVSTDTRKIEKGNIFFAIKGDNFNGNEFAEQALNSGASYAIIDEAKYKKNDSYILVDDTLKSLQKLANEYRKTLTYPFLALTGSNGKTTNKELIKAGLSAKYKVQATAGNLNNHIGVPLTILGLKKDTEFAVIEMGANHQGEIMSLCKIIEPNFGLITNIGKAHLEGFGGLEGVKKGKGELIEYLNENNGILFINPKELSVMEVVEKTKIAQLVLFENELELVSDNPKIIFEIEGKSYSSELSGYYNFLNIENAFGISTYFDVEKHESAKAISDYTPTNNRSQWIEKGSNLILMDAYNANPSSMAAAINTFNSFNTDKDKMVILGDMFEVGDSAEYEHEQIGILLRDSSINKIVLFGNNMKAALKHLPQAYFVSDKFSLHNWLQDNPFENTAVLVKGSRGVALETVLPFIAER